MDRIIRTMTKKRGDNFVQTFNFTTLAIAFAKPKDPQKLSNFEKLLKWIRHAFIVGLPEDVDTYESCSAATTPQPKLVEQIPHKENEFVALMEGCNYQGTSQLQHDLVENFLFKNDKRCVALEMPLWIDKGISPNGRAWAGSVDIVRILPNQHIQLCDFKPSAHKVDTKKVGAQLSRYGVMLHLLTGIPLADIEMIFFDSDTAYKITI